MGPIEHKAVSRDEIDRFAAQLVSEYHHDDSIICLEPTTPAWNFVVWASEGRTEEDFQNAKVNFTRTLADAIEQAMRALR